MFREIIRVAQNKPGFRRRWFEGKYFDLFTWQDTAGAFTSFQLCYDVERRERAFSWDAVHGFFHDGVSSGADLRTANPAILSGGGKLDVGEVLPRFQAEAVNIPADVRELVIGMIHEHLLERHEIKEKRKSVRREEWQQRQPPVQSSQENES